MVISSTWFRFQKTFGEHDGRRTCIFECEKVPSSLCVKVAPSDGTVKQGKIDIDGVRMTTQAKSQILEHSQTK